MFNNCVEDKAVRGAAAMSRLMGIGEPPALNRQRQRQLEFD
jgi:hypothetical protein